MEGGGGWCEGGFSGAAGPSIGEGQKKKLFKGQLVLLHKVLHELLKMRDVMAAKPSHFFTELFLKKVSLRSLPLVTEVLSSNVVFHMRQHLCVTQDSFPRIMLSLEHSARFFRRVGCWWSLG